MGGFVPDCHTQTFVEVAKLEGLCIYRAPSTNATPTLPLQRVRVGAFSTVKPRGAPLSVQSMTTKKMLWFMSNLLTNGTG